MNSFLNYLLEANTCLLVFGTLYMVLFKNETNFRFLRFYILGASILSLSVPLINVINTTALEELSIPLVSGIQEAITLPEFMINGPEASIDGPRVFSKLEWFTGIGSFYIAGILIFLTVFMYNIYRVVKFIKLKNGKIKYENKYQVVPTDGQFPTFSFLSYLFIDDSEDLSEEELKQVMDHEKVHILQKHSIDLILLEIVRIILWVNPMAWIFLRDIRNIHEYLADEKISKQSSEVNYSSLLAKMAIGKLSFPMGHHFNKSIILKRINMMKRPKRRLKKWKLITALPVILLTVLVFGCNEDLLKDVSDVMETSTQMEIPDDLQDKVAELQAIYPDADFIYMETDVQNENRVVAFRDVDPTSIAFVQVGKNKEIIRLIVNKNGPLKRINAGIQPADKVFTVVEEIASPVGGMAAFNEELVGHLKYPAEARELGIEGRVFVSFIIDKSGNITEPTVVRGIGSGCDEAAIEAISSVNLDWTPAKHRGIIVKQRMILPVTFRLGEGFVSVNIAEEEKNMNIEHNQPGDEVFDVVDEPASPLGGMTAFYEELAGHLQYPDKARQLGIEGKVFVSFIIDKSGNITEPIVKRGIGSGCDEAAIEAIRSVNLDWTPARQRGIVVNQRMILPVTFRLGEGFVSVNIAAEEKKMNIEQSIDGLTVLGTVTNEHGELMPGVNVIIKGTPRGTVSDRKGQYKIILDKEGDVLIHAFIGYKTEIIEMK